MSLEPLVVKVKEVHGLTAANKLQNGIRDEDHDWDSFVDIVNDDDDELDQLLQDFGLGGVDELKNTIFDYFKSGYFKIENNNISDKYVANVLIHLDTSTNKDLKDLEKALYSMKLGKWWTTTNMDTVWTEMLFYTTIIQKECKNLGSILLLLYDDYTKNYIYKYITKGKDLSYSDWGKINTIMNRLVKIETKALYWSLIYGIVSFGKRICPSISLPCINYISDDINDFAHIVLNVFDAVNAISEDYDLPFQLDVVIIPNKVSAVDAYDDDDSDGKTDDDITVFDNFEDEFNSFGNECIRINTNNVQNNRLKTFILEFIETRFARTDIKNPRIVIIVDKRLQNKNNNNIFIFIPKLNNTIPSDFIEEVFIENTRYIIKNAETSRVFGGMDRKILTLSFHMITKDFIKCYQYWDAKMTRFYLHYIYALWPYIFNSKIDGAIYNEIKKRANILKDKRLDLLMKNTPKKLKNIPKVLKNIPKVLPKANDKNDDIKAEGNESNDEVNNQMMKPSVNQLINDDGKTDTNIEVYQSNDGTNNELNDETKNQESNIVKDGNNEVGNNNGNMQVNKSNELNVLEKFKKFMDTDIDCFKEIKELKSFTTNNIHDKLVYWYKNNRKNKYDNKLISDIIKKDETIEAYMTNIKYIKKRLKTLLKTYIDNGLDILIETFIIKDYNYTLNDLINIMTKGLTYILSNNIKTNNIDGNEIISLMNDDQFVTYFENIGIDTKDAEQMEIMLKGLYVKNDDIYDNRLKNSTIILDKIKNNPNIKSSKIEFKIKNGINLIDEANESQNNISTTQKDIEGLKQIIGELNDEIYSALSNQKIIPIDVVKQRCSQMVNGFLEDLKSHMDDDQKE